MTSLSYFIRTFSPLFSVLFSLSSDPWRKRTQSSPSSRCPPRRRSRRCCRTWNRRAKSSRTCSRKWNRRARFAALLMPFDENGLCGCRGRRRWFAPLFNFSQYVALHQTIATGPQCLKLLSTCSEKPQKLLESMHIGSRLLSILCTSPPPAAPPPPPLDGGIAFSRC